MNAAHIHLWLNHIPVLGVLFGLLVLLVGLMTKSDDIKKASLLLFVLAALVAVPTFFSGKSAEEVVEDLPGVTEELIEEHEEAGLQSLIAIEILGLLALAGLIMTRGAKPTPSWVIVAVLLVSLISSVLNYRTANLGGEINHPEIRAEQKSTR
jgi:uncharacterized membrane protein